MPSTASSGDCLVTWPCTCYATVTVDSVDCVHLWTRSEVWHVWSMMVECMDVETWAVVVFLCGVGRCGPALGSFLIAVTETDEKQLEQRGFLVAPTVEL